MAVRIIDVVLRLNAAEFERALARAQVQAERTAAGLDTSFRRSSGALKKTGEAAVGLGRMMTGVGLAMDAVGYVSVKSAVTFQTSMTRIQTQANASKEQVASLSKAVLTLGASGQVQYGPTKLADALFHIESVATGAYGGLRKTSTAMMALKVAAKGAALGGTDLTETTTALMGALFATRAPLSALPKTMALLNATVGAGNMTMSDLVQALGRGVVPAFQQVGLKATDAYAAIALMSDSGVKASSGAAQLSTALHFLVQPSAKAAKYLGYINMNQIQMAEDLHKPQGLLVALEDLAGHMKSLPGGLTGVDAGQIAAALFPGGRGRIILTLLQNLDRYKGKLGAVYDASKKLKSSEDTQANTMGGKLHAAWAKIQTDLTIFGGKMAPIVAKYLPLFVHYITQMFGWLTRLSPAHREFIAKLAVALTVLGPLVGVAGRLVKVYLALKGAFLAIKAAGIAAAAGESGAAGGMNLLTAAMRRFAPFAAIYFGLQAAKKLPAAIASGNTGSAVVKGATIGGAGGVLAGVLGGAEFGPPGMLAGGLLGAFAGGGAGGILSKINPGGIFGSHGAQGGLVTHRGIRHMGMGGPIGSDNVPAWLSAGEGVLNRTAMAGLGAGGLAALNNGGLGGFGDGQPIVIYVNSILDGRLIARSVIQQTLRKAARGPSSLVGGQLVTGAASLGRGG
jgi:hypothetical protein